MKIKLKPIRWKKRIIDAHPKPIIVHECCGFKIIENEITKVFQIENNLFPEKISKYYSLHGSTLVQAKEYLRKQYTKYIMSLIEVKK
jgi:hypothetical protein